MIKILHIIERNEIYRSHLSFINRKDVINYYLVLKNTQIDDDKDRIYYFTNIDEAYKIILKLNIKIIIASNDKIIGKYHNKLKQNNFLLFRIYHGIILDYYMDTRKTSLINNFTYYDKIFCNIKMKIKLDKIRSNNYYGLNGLTQIDYLLDNKNKYEDLKHKFCLKLNNSNFRINDRYILFLTNNKKNHISDYNMIYDSLKTLSNYKIIIKIKQNSDLCKKKQKFEILNDNILIVNNNELLYDYLFCDIIIVQSGGTAYLESLILNKPTILISYLDKYDYMNIKKYNKLLIVYDETKLFEYIKMIEKNNYNMIDNNYEKDRQNVLYEYFGNLEFVTDKILNIINQIQMQ